MCRVYERKFARENCCFACTYKNFYGKNFHLYTRTQTIIWVIKFERHLLCCGYSVYWKVWQGAIRRVCDVKKSGVMQCSAWKAPFVPCFQNSLVDFAVHLIDSWKSIEVKSHASWIWEYQKRAMSLLTMVQSFVMYMYTRCDCNGVCLWVWFVTVDDVPWPLFCHSLSH